MGIGVNVDTLLVIACLILMGLFVIDKNRRK